jgi:hypothetical protein
MPLNIIQGLIEILHTISEDIEDVVKLNNNGLQTSDHVLENFQYFKISHK